MSFVRNLPIPKRLSPQVWLLTIPGTLASFERQQNLPKLPLGPARYLGVPLAGFGVGIIAWTWRTQGIEIKAPPQLAPLARKPALIGGLVAIAGVGLFLRSATVVLYALALAAAAASESIEVEEPTLESFTAGFD